jgi:2-oxoglutarate ferredoxin oxidoreductase subunit beta
MAEKKQKINIQQYSTGVTPTWCVGCGNFALLLAIRQLFAKTNMKPHNTVMTFDIGCAGNAASWHKIYSFHALHGRSLPVALGIKLANPSLTVIADAGEGGAYGEGGNHFLHACRGNANITLIVHNNKQYALTKGQPSPTTDEGYVSPLSPEGVKEKSLNGLQLAIVAGASFVARGFAGDVDHLVELFEKAVQHKGFALVEVLQPCVTNKAMNTFAWYRERVYRLKNWNAGNKDKALLKAGEWGKKIPIGVLYQEKKKRTTGKEKNLVTGVKKRGIEKLLEEFR